MVPSVGAKVVLVGLVDRYPGTVINVQGARSCTMVWVQKGKQVHAFRFREWKWQEVEVNAKGRVARVPDGYALTFPRLPRRSRGEGIQALLPQRDKHYALVQAVARSDELRKLRPFGEAGGVAGIDSEWDEIAEGEL